MNINKDQKADNSFNVDSGSNDDTSAANVNKNENASNNFNANNDPSITDVNKNKNVNNTFDDAFTGKISRNVKK